MNVTDRSARPIMDVEDLWWVFYLHKEVYPDTGRSMVDVFSQRGIQVVDEYLDDFFFQILLHDTLNDIHFEISNSSDKVTSYLFLCFKADLVTSPESPSARLNTDLVLEYSKVCYQALRPKYAFAERLDTYIKAANVDAARLTHICWANLFGTRFVEGVGYEILRNAPGWRNENLGDGGILYVLAASPYLYRGPRQYWEAARQYFRYHVAEPIVWSDMPG
jgi:hypothetical protein